MGDSLPCIDRGRAIRSPSIFDYGYLVQRPLARRIEEQAARLLGERRGLLVVDVGCGDKPYQPLLARWAGRHVGVDYPAPGVDIVGSSVALPIASGCADVVLCSQVLEHVPDPSATLREIARVLKPGGVVLLSTHGTYVFHPHPHDYWRWTQEGLRKVFEDTPGLGDIDLFPCGGSGSCLTYLLAAYAYLWSRQRPFRKARGMVRALVVPWLNLSGLLLDRVLARFRYPAPYSLIANFLVVARKTAPLPGGGGAGP
jgi:ubiquinone/menaquinone biosynthesis C-methylase UbiE